MPPLKRVPSYRLHKPSGQARVIVDGAHRYLGPSGSPESREEHARLIAERYAPGAGPEHRPTADRGIADARYTALPVNELLVRYIRFAETYYVRDGQPTGEVDNLKDAMGPLREGERFDQRLAKLKASDSAAFVLPADVQGDGGGK